MEINDLVKMIKDLGDNIKTDMNNMNNKFDTLQTDINNKITNVNNKIDNLQVDINNRFDLVDRRLDRVENSVHEVKIELEAKIDSKVDKMRSEMADLSASMDERIIKLTQQMDVNIAKINDTITEDQGSNAKALNLLSDDIRKLNGRVDEFLEQEIGERIDKQMRPAINSVRDTHLNILEMLDDVTKTVDALVSRGTVEPMDVYKYFKSLKTDIEEVKQQQAETRLDLSLAKTDVANLDRSLSKNISEISTRVDKVSSVPNKSEYSVIADDWRKDLEWEERAAKAVAQSRALRASKHGQKKVARTSDGDPDPEGSPPASDEDSSGEESDRSMDDNDRKRKKKDILEKEQFRPGGKRLSILGDPPDPRTSVDGIHPYFHSYMQPTMSVQPRPSTSDLFLDQIKIENVLAFCKKYNTLSVNYIGGLKVSNYLSDQVRSQLKQVADKHDLPGCDGLIRGGVQAVTNEEIFALLAIVCAPRKLQAMQVELSRSVFPKSNMKLYSEPESTLKHITDYKHDIQTYIDRFEDRLKLVGFTEKANAFIPKNLFRKGGQTGDLGLADYFIDGLPRKDFGRNIWMSVPEEKRQKCNTWKKFKRLYLKAIEDIEEVEHLKKASNVIVHGLKDTVKAEKAQSDAKRALKVGKRPQKLHALPSTTPETVLNDEWDAEDIPVSDIGQDDGPSVIDLTGEPTDSSEEDDPPYSPEGEELTPEESNVLAAAEYFGTCYDMANKGKCTRVDCKYSHKPEDIQRLKDLRSSSKPVFGSKSGPPKQVSFTKPVAVAARKT